jgi:iron complex transport system substrate-binding protein
MTRITRRSMMTAAAAIAAGALLPRAAAAQDASPAASGPITVEGAAGTLTLPETPARIVALEWSLVENVLALGVAPVGLADVEGYMTWVNVPLELPADVADVGQRLEPSLESIAALEPDLILTSEGRHEPIQDALSDIAPTLMIPADVIGDEEPPLAHTFESFRLIAAALGRAEAADMVIAEVEQTIADGAAAIEEAGQAGAPYVVVQAFTSENVPTMRIFSNDAQIGQTLTELGLENAWRGAGETSGFDTVTVEALVEVADANFFYIVQDTDDIFAEQLAEDPNWNSLTFVQEGRTYPLGGDTWTFGGPRSIEVIVEKALASFLAE